jgi:SNF2 family DNA or RNA helicase
MTSTVWLIDGNQIKLQTGSGETIRPTAMEIFQAVFGRAKTVGHDKVANPLESLTDLSFSRQPATSALRVWWGDDEKMAVMFGVATAGGFCGLAADTDQVIHEMCWYPVSLEQTGQAKVWLESIGVFSGQPLTVGSLVALRVKLDRPLTLYDEISFDPADFRRVGSAVGEIPGFTGVLYPYQIDGVSFLSLVAKQSVGCILGDEMGLGKTAQVIALLQLESNAGNGPALVIAPATLLENWKRELGIFAPTLTALVHSGAERGGIASRLRGHGVVLVSYDTAVRDEELLGQIPWNVMVLDEAQAIKNPQALRTLAVKRLQRRVSIAVTGTPLENSIDDLWSLADFALPGLLGDQLGFRAAFGNVLEDAARLAPVVAPLLLRRKVLDVAKDLPERIEIPQALQTTLPLAMAYEALRKKTLDEFGPAGGLVATTRLRMLCAHPSLVGDWDADPCIDVPKYVRTVELLEEIFSAGEKALVFSTYQAVADLLMADIPKRFTKGFFSFIDGRVEGSARQTVVDEFFAHPGYGALFLNPKAAGAGLNITAANHVIHYNPEWNPALTAQASARSYRRKQERPVTIHHLYYLQTVEEVIRDRAGFKSAMADEAVTGHGGEVDPLAIAHALQVSPIQQFSNGSRKK